MKRVSNYAKAIKAIITFKRCLDNIDPKTPRKLVGEIGEFYVLQKLQKIGFRPEHKGGQSGYDIYLKEIDKKIEIKTSLLKNEGVYSNKTIHFWGWTVERKNQKKIKKFDYLIGVALNDNFSNPKFYIFSYKEAFSVGNVNIGRFNNVKKKIYLFENKRVYEKALKLKPTIITSFERQINCHPSKFLDRWSKIK